MINKRLNLQKWTKKYHNYLRSKEWIQKKIGIIEIRGQRCEKCGEKKELKRLHLHHLNYKRIFNERSEDLKLLCNRCHMIEHEKKIQKPKRKKFSKKDRKIRRLKAKLKCHVITITEYSKRLKRIKSKRIDSIIKFNNKLKVKTQNKTKRHKNVSSWKIIKRKIFAKYHCKSVEYYQELMKLNHINEILKMK